MGSLLQLLRAPAEPSTEGSRPQDDEAALIERARGGGVEAWSRLYQDNYDKLYRYVAYLVGEAHATEDLVQETFAHAVVGLPQFGGKASLHGWLRGIALNLVRRHWRSRSRGHRAMDRLERIHEEAADAGPESSYLQQRRAEALMAALEELPTALREAFVACDLRELAAAEAAAELGISINNLRVRATRARARIRDELVRSGWLTAAEAAGGAKP